MEAPWSQTVAHTMERMRAPLAVPFLEATPIVTTVMCATERSNATPYPIPAKVATHSSASMVTRAQRTTIVSPDTAASIYPHAMMETRARQISVMRMQAQGPPAYVRTLINVTTGSFARLIRATPLLGNAPSKPNWGKTIPLAAMGTCALLTCVYQPMEAAAPEPILNAQKQIRAAKRAFAI